jgi:hypothetical protein
MLSLLPPLVVLLVAMYLIALAAIALWAPALAARFLGGFAGSPGSHYLELALRLIAGAAFLLHAPEMRFATAFTVFGWILIVTTAGLLAVPWRWHRRFAERTVPAATRHLPLIAAASFALGGLILAATLLGSGLR